MTNDLYTTFSSKRIIDDIVYSKEKLYIILGENYEREEEARIYVECEKATE